MSWAFVLMLGMPYDISMGNLDRPATPCTSCLLIAVLKVCQKVSNEFAAWLTLFATAVPVSNSIRDRVVIFFIMVQSAAQY